MHLMLRREGAHLRRQLKSSNIVQCGEAEQSGSGALSADGLELDGTRSSQLGRTTE